MSSESNEKLSIIEFVHIVVFALAGLGIVSIIVITIWAQLNGVDEIEWFHYLGIGTVFFSFIKAYLDFARDRDYG